FGHAAPLAIQAKPSDFAHGSMYALAGIVVCATPVVLLARLRGASLAIALAAAVHVLAVMAAGGDWMPYARLLAPIAPGLVFAAARSESTPWWFGMRAFACAALGAWMWIAAAPPGRGVARDRRDLVLRARPLLEGKTVACVDIGWVGAATNHSVIDMAGLTDP